MFITHDNGEAKVCSFCHALVNYFELIEVGSNKLACEYCVDEIYLSKGNQNGNELY